MRKNKNFSKIGKTKWNLAILLNFHLIFKDVECDSILETNKSEGFH